MVKALDEVMLPFILEEGGLSQPCGVNRNWIDDWIDDQLYSEVLLG